jgi:hypothetical protein
MLALSDPSAGHARPEVNLTVGITIPEVSERRVKTEPVIPFRIVFARVRKSQRAARSQAQSLVAHEAVERKIPTSESSARRKRKSTLTINGHLLCARDVITPNQAR